MGQLVSLQTARLDRLARRANSAHEAALDHAGKAVDAAISAGTALLAAKQQLPYGAWISWLESNVTFGRRCASNYMKLAVAGDKLGNGRSQLSIGQALRLISASDTMTAMSSSSSSEFYTPEIVAKLADRCLAGISLDPCSAIGSPIQAKRRYFTEGLERPWRGTCWVNPPFGREIGLWVQKLASEYNNGNVKSALLLTPSRTDAEWFRLLDDRPIAFIHGRLKFGNSSVHAPFATCISYFGLEVRRFAATFSPVATIFTKYSN